MFAINKKPFIVMIVLIACALAFYQAVDVTKIFGSFASYGKVKRHVVKSNRDV